MSNYEVGDVVSEDENGNELEHQYIKLDDGRVSIAHDGVDHRASASEIAKTITKLEKHVKEGYELVEVVCGDDCLWWAVVPVAK